MNRRFALLQAAFSLVALGAVVWWASHQDPPRIPHAGSALAWLAGGGALYAVATLVRAERWHRILHLTGVEAGRADCYGLTTVGYMGNNVLPARAGEALRVVLLDVIALAVILALTAYGVLSDRDVLPTDQPLVIAGAGVVVLALGALAFSVLRRRGALARFRDFARPLAGAPRALLGPAGAILLAGTFGLWLLEGGVYLAVAHAVDLDISASGALYLVALANFVAALPAAPGSIGTFDAAVAFGAKALGGASAAVIAYLLLLRFILYLPITLVGLTVMVVRYGGWTRLRSAARLHATQA